MRARELLVPVRMVVGEDATVKDVDEAIGRALRDVPSAIWQEYVKVVEKEAIEQSGGALRRKSSEERQLRTSYGDVQFTRGRFYYSDNREPGTVMVFDSRIDMRPRQSFTPGAQTKYARLAALAPSYKCASQIAELLVGEAPSDWWIWQRTRDEGRRLRERDRHARGQGGPDLGDHREVGRCGHASSARWFCRVVIGCASRHAHLVLHAH